MKWLCIALLVFLTPEDAPYRAGDDFEARLKFELKPRHAAPVAQGYSSLRPDIHQTPPLLPFLTIDFKVLRLYPGEVRVRIEDGMGETVLSRKVTEGMALPLTLGFTDDLKGHPEGYAYSIYFMTQDREVTSRVVIFFEENGIFRINGEPRGKI
ncbi:hypothetical protein [Parachryseolinea silvisoli]|uniref:hypothetical protein n=1 Tax=Parachryseolinea silvisoli TaxID=2873601 RepID=UPI002265E34B|nr:hypothetical protein [Parachryseolinea silvisoli]MCD9018368.1 hypothetical protein [Parachryseolinea silvisoli]